MQLVPACTQLSCFMLSPFATVVAVVTVMVIAVFRTVVLTCLEVSQHATLCTALESNN